MRILTVSRRFGAKGETRGIQTERLVRAISEKGCEVTVLSEAGVALHSKAGERMLVEFDPSNAGWKDKVLNKAFRGGARSKWSRFASEQLKELRGSKKFDSVVSLSTPFESHLSVLDSNCWGDLPWAAFFSDPWPPHTLPAPYPRLRDYLSAPIQCRRLEQVLNHVKVVASPSAHVLSEMAKIGGTGRQQCLLPHMVPDSYSIDGAWSKKLLHCGTLTPERISRRLLDFLKVASCVLAESDWNISFVGRGSNALQGQLRGTPVARLEATESVSPSEAKRMVNNAGILFVVEADMRRSPFVPSKLAEALASRRPVICFSPDESAARQVADGEEGVYFVSPSEASNVERIRSVLALAIERAERPLARDGSRFSASGVADKLLVSLERAVKCFQPSV